VKALAAWWDGAWASLSLSLHAAPRRALFRLRAYRGDATGVARRASERHGRRRTGVRLLASLKRASLPRGERQGGERHDMGGGCRFLLAANNSAGCGMWALWWQ